MRERAFQIWIWISVVGLALASGCSDSSAPRSVLHVTDINENRPLQSDVIDMSGGGTVYEDQVVVQIRSDPHDGALNLSRTGPYGYVVLDSYRIRFESTEAIPEVSGALGWTVHVGEEISGDLVIVPGALKMAPPLIGLVSGGEILSTARITISGHETTSDATVTLETALPVHFANWSD